MTVFKKPEKTEDQGTWFKYQDSHFDKEKKEFVFDDPEENAAEFCIRSVVPFYSERLKARKKQYQFVLNPSTRSMERVSYFNDLSPDEAQKETDDAADYMITGIRNAFFEGDKPIDCTRENKLILFQDKHFDLFVGRCLKILAENEAKQAEQSEKN